MEPIVTMLRRGPEVKALVAGFVRVLPDLCREVQGEVALGHLQEAARLAHRLKGSAAGYGFPTVQDLAAAVERCAANGDALGCQDMAAELVRMSSWVRAEPTD